MRTRKAKITIYIILVILAFLGYSTFSFLRAPRELDYSQTQKNIVLSDNGLEFKINTNANSVAQMLNANKIKLGDYDKIWPEPDTPLHPGTNVEIKRAISVTISADEKEIKGHSTAKNISGALEENGITLGRLDKVAPDKSSSPQTDKKIIVTRINVEDITVDEDIDFPVISKKDPKMGWREKNIETPGEPGTREVVYRVTYKNGQEVSRVALSKKTIKNPVTQVETQGTYMQLKKAAKGQATWYAYKGGMFAASTTIPKGNYAKVTATASDKSIVVQINDYGPQGKGRIIDLDKVAFEKLAPLGAGVINVKVE